MNAANKLRALAKAMPSYLGEITFSPVVVEEIAALLESSRDRNFVISNELKRNGVEAPTLSSEWLDRYAKLATILPEVDNGVKNE